MTKPSDDHDEHQLVTRIANGDEQAFQLLFDHLAQDVFKLCYSLLLDHQRAEDAAQEVFVKLWQHAKNWKPEAKVKTWLLKVARNHCFDMLRKKKSDLKKNHDLYKDHLSSHTITSTSAVEVEIDQKKQQAVINAALFNLPERQREAIILVYYNEVKNMEAADIMDMQAVAFDSLLARARRNLRETLENDTELKGCFYETK